MAEAGDKIRALKAAGATNTDASVQEGVASLKALKAELAALEKAAGISPPEPAPAPKKKPQQQQKQKQTQSKKGAGKKGAEGAEGGTSSAEEVRRDRVGKVAALRDAGEEPFAYRFDRTHTAAELQKAHESLGGGR